MQPLKIIKPLTEFSGNSPQLMYIIFLRIVCFQKTL